MYHGTIEQAWSEMEGSITFYGSRLLKSNIDNKKLYLIGLPINNINH